MFDRILVALDNSEPSQVALRTAIALALAEHAALAIVTVHDERLLESTMTGEDATGLEMVIEEDEREGKELLETARSAAQKAGIANVEVEMYAGDPAFRIVEAAAARKADLVVVSTHGRTGIVRFFVGSVAEHVVRHAPCSVFVARPVPAATP